MNSDKKLAHFRESIDRLDNIWVNALVERFNVSRQIGQYKAENGLLSSDHVRMESQLKRIRDLVSNTGGNDPELTDFIASLLQQIFEKVISEHLNAENHD